MADINQEDINLMFNADMDIKAATEKTDKLLKKIKGVNNALRFLESDARQETEIVADGNKKYLERVTLVKKLELLTSRMKDDSKKANPLFSSQSVSSSISMLKEWNKEISRVRNQIEATTAESVKSEIQQTKSLTKQQKAQENLNVQVKYFRNAIKNAASTRELKSIETQLNSAIRNTGVEGVKTTRLRNLKTKGKTNIASKMSELSAKEEDARIQAALQKQEELEKRNERLKKFAEEWRKLTGEAPQTKREAREARLTEITDKIRIAKAEMKQLAANGEESSERFAELSQQVKKLAPEAKKLEKSLKPTGWQKLVSTFKRIGFYRLARDTFRIIINGFKEGIQLFANFDKNANQTMSDLTGSFTVIKASLSSMLLTVVEMFAPSIRDIATGFANVANEISKASALLRGASEYTKINADYMKEYGDAAKQALLSFDKFESLNNDNNDGLFSTEKIGEVTEETEKWKNTLSGIKEVVDFVWGIIKDISAMLGRVWKENIEPNMSIIKEGAKTILGVVETIAGWLVNIFAWLVKNKDVLSVVVPLLLYAASAVAFLFQQWGLGFKLLGMAVGSTLISAALHTHSEGSVVKNTADGKSQTNSGMSDSVAEAITTTSELNSTSTPVVINIDSQKLAETNVTKAIANEWNRGGYKLNVT